MTAAWEIERAHSDLSALTRIFLRHFHRVQPNDRQSNKGMIAVPNDKDWQIETLNFPFTSQDVPVLD